MAKVKETIEEWRTRFEEGLGEMLAEYLPQAEGHSIAVEIFEGERKKRKDASRGTFKPDNGGRIEITFGAGDVLVQAPRPPEEDEAPAPAYQPPEAPAYQPPPEAQPAYQPPPAAPMFQQPGGAYQPPAAPAYQPPAPAFQPPQRYPAAPGYPAAPAYQPPAAYQADDYDDGPQPQGYYSAGEPGGRELGALIQALAQAEQKPGFQFVSLKWFRDTFLPRECPALIGAGARLLWEATESGIVLTGKSPNPTLPQFPVTTVRLNRQHPEVVAALGGAASGRSGFRPVRIRGESLSQTVIQERI